MERSELAIWLGVAAPVILAMIGVAIAFIRGWINAQIVSKLSNDDTPVAVYAHQALSTSAEALSVGRETRQMLVEHIEASPSKDDITENREIIKETLAVARETRGLLFDHIKDREIHRRT